MSPNDQFMPSVDFDSSGNGRVTFYDRREDPTNTAYKLYRVKIPLGYPFVASFIGNPTIGDGSNGDVWLAYFY